MQGHNRSLLVNAAPVLLAAAIIGYLAGGGLSSAGPPRVSTALVKRAFTVSNAVVLEYPSASGWQPASGTPRVPDLPIAQSLLLAPHGDATRAGLIAGQMVDNRSSPLPPRFLARVPQLPKAEVVSLLNTQAYRYSQLSSAGLDRRLTIYAIPNAMGTTTTIVCYATPSAALSSDLRACEQIAAQLTLQVEAQSQGLLTPDAGYAHQIDAAIGRVDKLRAALRPAMRLRAAPANLSGLATRLADGLASAAESLSVLQPPSAAGWTHAALCGALSRVRNAYLALAAAASAGDPPRYAAARTLVYETEANLNSVLKSFALFGYE